MLKKIDIYFTNGSTITIEGVGETKPTSHNYLLEHSPGGVPTVEIFPMSNIFRIIETKTA